MASLGPLTPYNPPTIQALQEYNVNRAGQVEVIWQPKYDYYTYPVAGATQLTFFQTPVGQAGSTYAETNMESAGQMPRPKEFLVTGIQVFFNPNNPVSVAGGPAATTVATNWIDVDNVMQGRAWLDFFIGSKTYLRDAPLEKFTQQFRLGGEAALAAVSSDMAAANLVTQVDYAVHVGRYYSITPIKLPSNQNFNVTLNFPVAIPLVVSETARIGVILDGFEYRLSQ